MERLRLDLADVGQHLPTPSRFRPMLARTQPNFERGWPSPGRCWPNLAGFCEFWATLADIGTILATVWAMPTWFGSVSAKFGPIWADFELIWAGFVQIWSKGPSWTEVVQSRTDSAQSWVEHDQFQSSTAFDRRDDWTGRIAAQHRVVVSDALRGSDLERSTKIATDAIVRRGTWR